MNLPNEYFFNNPDIVINNMHNEYFIELAKILKNTDIKTIAYYVQSLLINKVDKNEYNPSKVVFLLKYKFNK